MKLLKKLSILYGFSLTSLCLTAQTTTVETDPFGFVKLDIAANGYTFIGTPLINESSFVGAAVSVSATDVTFNADSFTAGEFDQVVIDTENVPQYIFEVTSGTDVGVMIPIVSNTTDTLTLNEDVSAYVSAGTTGQVRALHTLDSLFPDGEPLNTSSSPASADQVLIFDYEKQTSESYFYYSFLGTEEWRSGVVPNGLRSILPNESVYIIRRGEATSVTFSGSVKMDDAVIDIFPGYNFVPNPYPIAYSLDLSNLYTGDSLTGLASGSSPASADEVIIYDSNATPTTYFYYSFLGTDEWRSGSNPSGDVEIPVGGAIMINRKAPRNSFSWIKTRPF